MKKDTIPFDELWRVSHRRVMEEFLQKDLYTRRQFVNEYLYLIIMFS